MQKYDYDKEVLTDINQIIISKKYRLVGSQKDKNILFANDYDIEDEQKHYNYPDFLKHIQDKYHYAMNSQNSYIIDFKAGDLHWTFKNVLNGYKFVKGKKIYLIDALKKDARIKLDMIFLLHDRFVEFSCIYKVGQNNEDPIIGIKKDIEELFNNKNFPKIIKRLYSLAKLQKQDTKQIINFLNSKWGLFYQSVSDMKTLILLLEQTMKPIPLTEIKTHLQIIKQNLAKIDDINVSQKINKICEMDEPKMVLKSLVQLEKSLSKVLNKEAEVFIDTL